MSTRYEREATRLGQPITDSATHIKCCGERHHVEVFWPWCLRPITHEEAFTANLPSELALEALGGGMSRCAQVNVAWKRMIREALRGLDAAMPMVDDPKVEDLTSRYLDLPEGLRATAQRLLRRQIAGRELAAERLCRSRTALRLVTRDLIPPAGRSWDISVDAGRKGTTAPTVSGTIVVAPTIENSKIMLRTIAAAKLWLIIDPVRYLWAYHATGGIAWSSTRSLILGDSRYVEEPFLLLDVERLPRDGWHLAKAIRCCPPVKSVKENAVKSLAATVLSVWVRPAERSQHWEARL